MSDDRLRMSQREMVEAQQSIDIAALNGIVSLAIVLKKRGLLTPDEAESMHEMMSKPLSLPHNASNPLVQDVQQNLDQLFTVLLERR